MADTNAQTPSPLEQIMQMNFSFAPACIMTAALRAVTAYAFREHPELRRIYAVPYVTSTASAHILEKAGYRLEGRLRQSVIKDGHVLDQFMYAILRDEVPQ